MFRAKAIINIPGVYGKLDDNATIEGELEEMSGMRKSCTDSNRQEQFTYTINKDPLGNEIRSCAISWACEFLEKAH